MLSSSVTQHLGGGGSGGGGSGSGGSGGGGGDSYSGGSTYGDPDGRPIALDINKDGKITHIAATSSTVMWDFDRDGFATCTGWIGPQDGFLIYDKDSDNHVTATDEVSFISYVSGAKTDLEGLKHFDSNNDGKLTSADAQWAKFKVWVDANQNGRTDNNEVTTLASHTITGLDLTINKATKTDKDNTIFQDIVVSLTGGKTMLGQDVGFAGFGEAMRLEVYADGLFMKSKAADGVIRSVLISQHNSGLTVDVNDFKWLAAFAGTAFADTITHSGSSNMIINGLDGNDKIKGGAGNDVLYGGNGRDILSGGEGSDTFILNPDLSGLDIVTDFSHKKISGRAEYDGKMRGGNDKLRIDLDEADITAITAKTSRAEKLAALADAAEIRWGLGSYFSQTSATNDNTKQETLIYDTKGTASLRDDVTIMVLEDFTDDLTWAMFEIA